MAIVTITPDKLELNTGKALTAGKALDASDGAYIDFTGKDHNILILLTGSAADTVTIKAGDGIQGVADERHHCGEHRERAVQDHQRRAQGFCASDRRGHHQRAGGGAAGVTESPAARRADGKHRPLRRGDARRAGRGLVRSGKGITALAAF